MADDADLMSYLEHADAQRDRIGMPSAANVRAMTPDAPCLVRVACWAAILLSVAALFVPSPKHTVDIARAKVEQGQRDRAGNYVDGGYEILRANSFPDDGNHAFELTLQYKDAACKVAVFGAYIHDIASKTITISVSGAETLGYRRTGKANPLARILGGAIDPGTEGTLCAYAQTVAGNLPVYALSDAESRALDEGYVTRIYRTASGLHVEYEDGMGWLGVILIFAGFAGVGGIFLMRAKS